MSDRLRFDNPGAVSNPLGLYSHCVTVPEGVELIFLSGQVGVRPDGTCGESVAEQADQVFANIVAILKAQRLSAENIVKLTTFMVAGCDGQKVREARLKHLGEHRPASTAVYVAALVDPAWLVEVEAIAARNP